MEINQNINCLKEALTLLKMEEDQCVWIGEFVSLFPSDNKFGKDLNRIVQDIWNISTIAHRLEWMRGQIPKDKFVKNMWMNYASLDVDHFHIELRSIMDYLAKIISQSASKPSRLPDSFNSLLKGLTKKKYNNLLERDLIEIVESTRSWFYYLRDRRDAITHKGEYAIVFPETRDGFLFLMANQGFDNLDFKPLIMQNLNCAYFDRYAAILFSKVLVLLENVAKTIGPKFGSKIKGNNARCASSGFIVLRYWIENILDNN